MLALTYFRQYPFPLGKVLVVLLFGWLALAHPIMGQPAHKLTDSIQLFNPAVRYAFIPEDESDWRTVKNLDSSRFQFKKRGAYFSFHGPENEIWLTTQIENKSSHQEWMLVFDNPLIDEMNVYLFHKDSLLTHYTLGDRFKFSERPLPTRPLVVPITLEPNKTYDILVNVDTDGRRTNPVLLVMTSSYFYKWELGKRNELFLLYVFLVLLGLVTFYLAWMFRDKVFGWLGLFYVLNFLIYLATGGFAGQYLWPEWPGVGSKLPGVLVFLSYACIVGFARAFLVETVSKLKIDFVLKLYMAFSVVMAFLSIFDGWILYASVWVMYRMIPVTYVLIFIILIYSLFKRHAAAALCLIGVGICIMAMLLLESPDEQSGHVFNNRNYVFTIAIGFLMLTFAAIDRLRVYKEYEKEMQLHRERERIARDLHDNIGSRLTSLALALRQQSKDKNVTQEWIDSATEHANESLSELRDTIWVMTKDRVTVAQLRDKIEHTLWRIQRENHSMEFRLEPASADLSHTLSPDQAVNLFRVLQESLNNSIKHSGATKITVRLTVVDKQIHLVVEDNGKGFDTKAPLREESFGLRNMRQRAEYMNAFFSVDSFAEQGTLITVKLPL